MGGPGTRRKPRLQWCLVRVRWEVDFLTSLEDGALVTQLCLRTCVSMQTHCRLRSFLCWPRGVVYGRGSGCEDGPNEALSEKGQIITN